MRHTGFSLVECMVALALFSAIAATSITILFQHRERAAAALSRVQARGLAQAQAVGAPIFPLPSAV